MEKVGKMTPAVPVGQAITSPTGKTPGLPKSPSLATDPLAKTPSGPHGSLTSDDSSYPSSSDESSNGHQGNTNAPNNANPLPAIFSKPFNLSPRLTNDGPESAPQQCKLPYTDTGLKQQREVAVSTGEWNSEVNGGDDYLRSGSSNGKPPTPPEDDWPRFDPIGLFPPHPQLPGNLHLTTQSLPPGVPITMLAPHFAASGMPMASVPMALPLGPRSHVVMSPPLVPKPEVRNKKLQTTIRVPHQDQEIQAVPAVGVRSVQTDPPPAMEEAEAQTDLVAITAAGLVPTEELTPPKMPEEAEGEHVYFNIHLYVYKGCMCIGRGLRQRCSLCSASHISQLKFVTEYSIQVCTLLILFSALLVL